MSVAVDDLPDLVKYPDPKLRRIGRRRADSLDPLPSVALSRPAGTSAPYAAVLPLFGNAEGAEIPKIWDTPASDAAIA